MTRRPHRAINQYGVSLRDHIEQRLEAMEKAVDVARDEMTRRLDGMNHLQAQLNKQSDLFLLKELYEREHKVLIERVDLIREDQLTKADSEIMREVQKKIDGHISEQLGKETSLNRTMVILSLGSGVLGAVVAWLLMHK